MADRCLYVAYEWECGDQWESGKPARHHICVKRKGHGGECKCECGVEKMEMRVDAV